MCHPSPDPTRAGNIRREDVASDAERRRRLWWDAEHRAGPSRRRLRTAFDTSAIAGPLLRGPAARNIDRSPRVHVSFRAARAREESQPRYRSLPSSIPRRGGTAATPPERHAMSRSDTTAEARSVIRTACVVGSGVSRSITRVRDHVDGTLPSLPPGTVRCGHGGVWLAVLVGAAPGRPGQVPSSATSRGVAVMPSRTRCRPHRYCSVEIRRAIASAAAAVCG